MELTNTCRLIPSLYPSRGILDQIASPEDLTFVIELESWTNDRISAQLGLLHCLPPDEWNVGRPFSSVVMASFCHPRPGGGRFNGPGRGAWYAGLDLDTAHAEIVYHRSVELAEVGIFEMRLQMRLYQADFRCPFEDIRHGHDDLHDPHSYVASQAFARQLLESGSFGVLYRSVRHPGGECIACFRPKAVDNVRAAAYFEYRWEGGPVPSIRRIG
jgi:hypothetical protein